jgi:DNA sulfur modification protein DndD
MQISLLGWSSEGMRCPDVRVDLADGLEPSAVSLVQMPNGTGKTTTLSLLEAAMNGSAAKWPEEQIRGFRRPGAQADRGTFVVRLAVDGKPLTFELTLNFLSGTASYRTTNPGSGGVVQNWAPIPSVRRFLKPEFLNLFIFDGEFAGKLFDSRQLEAEYAIEALCQLYVLDDVGSFAEDAWNRRAKQAPVKSEAGLARLQENHRALLKRKADVIRYRETAQASANRLAVEIEELERRIKAKLSGGVQTRERFDAAQQKLASAANKLTRISGEAMQALRMPLALHPAFGRDLVQLKEGLDKLRLPENSSAQFFQELLEETDCICGREMTEGAREEIRARSERYLDAADAGTINALKADVEAVGPVEGDGSPHSAFEALIAELAAARKEQRLATQEVEGLKKQLKDQGETEIETWEQEQAAANSKLLECRTLLSLVDGEGEELDEDVIDLETWSLASLERQIAATSNRIARITDTLTVRRQTELIVRILKRTGELARAQIKSELIEACNARIAEVLVNDPLRIASIDKSLRLEGQAGASVGQTLSIGYVFLMTVLSRGNNDLPLVVDSPANPIDAGVRRRIGALIPKLTKQFVGFTINTEREGFVPALQSASDDVRYLTLFRRTPGTERLMANLPQDRAQVTQGAVLVNDRQFFESFDLEEEG